MAIEKTTEMGTGATGDYWALTDVARIRPVDGGFAASVDFSLYKSAADYAAGRDVMHRMRRIHVQVAGVDPKHSDWEAAGQAVLLKASIDEVIEVIEVKAVDAVVPVAGVPATDDTPEVKAVKGAPAVDFVAGVAAAPAVKGGLLEGGRPI